MAGGRQRTYSDAFKNWILQRHAMGARVSTLSREHGMCQDTVIEWRKKAQADGRWDAMLAAAARSRAKDQQKRQPATPKAGVTVHTGGSPWLGHRVALHQSHGAKVLPPGLGAVGGERDKEAAARLRALEGGAKI